MTQTRREGGWLTVYDLMERTPRSASRTPARHRKGKQVGRARMLIRRVSAPRETLVKVRVVALTLAASLALTVLGV